MNKILIFGNIIKDIYLELAEDESFEKDEKEIDWMNLGFNASKHYFSERTAMFGGAEVTRDVFSKFGLEAEIAGHEEGKAPKEYRYILCKDEGIAYFASHERGRTDFVEVEGTRLIFLDRTAGVTEEFSRKLREFKEKNPRVPVVVHLPKRPNEAAKEAAKIADLIFCEKSFPETSKDILKDIDERKVCYLSLDGIEMGRKKLPWKLRREDMMTHLTLFSTATATLLAATLKRIPTDIAMKMTRANVLNAKLYGSLSQEELMNIVTDENRQTADLREIAKMLVASGKGILAADESGGSIHKKFENMGIADDEEHRREYRNIFFTTPDLEKYVNGVILFDETARQKADDGRNFTEYLTGKGIIPGIKVDQGLKNFANSEEKYTSGLSGLRERLAEYYKMGLRFAKWRAAFEITETTPSEYAIKENCKILAEYALDCQAEQIVPIVEPEVVFDGNYSLNTSKEITSKILRELFSALREKNVDLSATILKVNMCIAGKKFPTQSTSLEVGRATAEVLRENVPKELAGVVFLSGGQTVEQATENLREVSKNGPFPWPVTFSFARALQEPALNAWKGKSTPENLEKAKEGFRARLIANCEALEGK